MIKRSLYVGAAIAIAACQPAILPDAPKADMAKPLEIFETLSSDAMEGRQPQTEGHEKARGYIEEQMLVSGYFDEIGERTFPATAKNKDGEIVREFEGRNIYGIIDADPEDSRPILIITAHYDHLGVHKGQIFNGADDNASGCAALFAIAKSFRDAAPDHDIIFAWLDVEEEGLQGAFALVADEKLLGDRRAVNLNLDMISRNEKEIYLSGTYHYPEMKRLLKNAAHNTGIVLKLGHDRPSDRDQDWTMLSDHGAFHAAGIPFAYFGVEDHAHYHKPSDDFETIPQEFYQGSVQTVINAAHILEANLSDLAKPVSQR